MRLSSGISCSMDSRSRAQYSCTRPSPMPARLTTTPKGMASLRTISTASWRSYRPNGVGSVTRTTKSEPCSVVTTGQDVPGGASRIVKAGSDVGDTERADSFAALIRGGAVGTPTSRRPCTRVPLVSFMVSTTPMRRRVSLMAPRVQTRTQPPQP